MEERIQQLKEEIERYAEMVAFTSGENIEEIRVDTYYDATDFAREMMRKYDLHLYDMNFNEFGVGEVFVNSNCLEKLAEARSFDEFLEAFKEYHDVFENLAFEEFQKFTKKADPEEIAFFLCNYFEEEKKELLYEKTLEDGKRVEINEYWYANLDGEAYNIIEERLYDSEKVYVNCFPIPRDERYERTKEMILNGLIEDYERGGKDVTEYKFECDLVESNLLEGRSKENTLSL